MSEWEGKIIWALAGSTMIDNGNGPDCPTTLQDALAKYRRGFGDAVYLVEAAEPREVKDVH